MKLSIAQRLALMFAQAALLVFALIGFTLYHVLENQVLRYQQAELSTKLKSVAGSVRMCDNIERWHKVRDKVDNLVSADRSTQYWAWSGDPRFRLGDAPPKPRAPAAGEGAMGVLPVAGSHYAMRTLSQTVPAHGERPEVELWVGIDSEPYVSALRSFAVALWALCIGGTLLVALLGHWIARVGMRPVERLSREAQALSPSKLSQRLQPAQLSPELAQLTDAFNGALGRLEAAYKRLDAFNADVAHELRTPLTNMIGQTQVALSRPREAERFQDVLQSNLEELERMRGIINDMLFLARADQGDILLDCARVPLASEVAKTGEFLEYLLEEAGMRLRISGDVEAFIDQSLFRRALTNLLHNAVQHATPGSEIVVTLTHGEDGAKIEVSNLGSTVAQEHLARMFDRFYRADASRADASRSHGGEHHHGLGLSIVKAIAALHGGGVFASSSDGATTVGFSLAERRIA